MAYWLDIYRFSDSNEYEYKYAGKYGAKGEKRQEKSKPTPWQIELQNQLNKATRIRRIIKANFEASDMWITLTYERNTRKSMDEVKRDVEKFIQKIRRRYKKYGEEMKWMRVIEIGSRGGIHVHMLLNRLRVAEAPDTDIIVCECWPHGRPFHKNLYAEDGYQQLASYMAKIPDEEERKAKKMPRKLGKEEYSFSTSRNLIRPKPERHDRKVWTVRKLVREGPKPTPGYYIVKSSVKIGVNQYTGYSYMRYTEEKLDRRI